MNLRLIRNNKRGGIWKINIYKLEKKVFFLDFLIFLKEYAYYFVYKLLIFNK